MTLNDPLANVLSAIMNAERRGKKEIVTKNSSRLIRTVLDLMKASGYIEGYEVTQDAKGDLLAVRLAGRINGVGVIKPRHQVGKDGLERFEKRFLPAKDFGIIIVSTNQGLMTHMAAKELGIGGTLISYCY